ncbi:DUF2206 domain-containing protein [Chloroflexota bacterium]
MNQSDNNSLLMLLFFTIPAYIIFLAVYRSKVPQKLYPIIIFLISISLLLVTALRSNHILGSDVHDLYYYFQLTSESGLWKQFFKGLTETCMSTTVLPTVYNSLLNINPELLFKVLFPVLFSISPLVVYIIARKYIGAFYAFLASFFFMSQVIFLQTSLANSTNMAILFVALSIMALLNDDISEYARKLLFIVFVISCILSHYSTSFIFFFILLLTWFGIEVILRISIRGKKLIPSTGEIDAGQSPSGTLLDNSPPENNDDTSRVTDAKAPVPRLRKGITLSLIVLVFTIIFFWYGQITVTPFEIGVGVIYKTLANLSEWYLLETKGTTINAALGQNVSTIPQQIRVIVSWITVAFIGIGVVGTMARYKKTVVIPGLDRLKESFLHSKFEITYMMMAISCSAILVLSTIVPFIMAFYSMERTYFQMMVVLSPFLVIGGLMIAKLLKTRPHWLILAVLVPFFLCTTGALYQVLGYPVSLILNSSGAEYKTWYLHDQDSYAAKWIKAYGKEHDTVFTYSWPGPRVLKSQAAITSGRSRPLPDGSVSEGEKTSGYIYLRYNDIIINELVIEYPLLFNQRNKVYTAGISEVYR